MAEGPDAIRDAIDETRQDLADTIQALGHKADVKDRVPDSVHGRLLFGLFVLVVVVAVPLLRSRRRRH